MDYYKNIQNLKNKFIEFINKTPSLGKTFLCTDDKNIKNIVPKLRNKNFYTYGLNNNSNFFNY